MLTDYYPAEGGRDAALAAIKEDCGRDLAVAEDLEEIVPPPLDELLSVRMFDPHSFFLGKEK